MSFAERLAESASKVVTFDIERMKGRAEVEFWDLGDFKNRRIHADDVTLWPRTICLAWREYGKKRVEFASEWDDGREGMLHRAWEMFDQADVLYGHNVDGFDVKKLNAEWALMGLPPPTPFKTVDTLKLARRRFGYESNTLNALCVRLDIVAKTDRFDAEVARAALAGDKAAQKRLKGYNIGDVKASEALVDALRAWVDNHPHDKHGTIDDRLTCPSCWGTNLTRNGTKLANQITYTMWRCECGANVQGTRHNRAALTKGAR